MTPKYYVEIEEEGSYPECHTCPTFKFHHDSPHDSIDDAKSWATRQTGSGYKIVVYECLNSIMKPVLVRPDYGEAWEEYK